jgi:hypothetical protein
VGGASLFETLQSRVGKIPRFLDIANKNDDSAYYTNNTCYKLNES